MCVLTYEKNDWQHSALFDIQQQIFRRMMDILSTAVDYGCGGQLERF
uniref:Uncharacterized protein n=1 Tax=Arundo donax TaxID=35708 RepID=A0A0A9BZ46_ARUDO